MSGSMDAEEASLLAELWSTPVGRRWVLKAGLGSAAAAVAAHLWGGAAVAEAARRKDAVVASTSLQFALGSVRGVSDLALTANGHTVALVAHTRATRAALRRHGGGLWDKVDLAALSHHVPEVPSLPEDRAILITVYGLRGRRRVVVAHLWHVPPATTLALAKTAHRFTDSLAIVTPSPHRLNALGISPAEITTPLEVVQLNRIVDETTTASGLVMMHPNVATIDKTANQVTSDLLGKTVAVGTLAKKIAQMHKDGQDLSTQVQATNRDGSPAQITVGDQTTTFTTIKLSDDPELRSKLKDAVGKGIRAVRDDGRLGAVIDKPLDEDKAASTKTWVQPQGTVPQATRYQPSAARAAAAGVEIKIRDEGLLYGTYTARNGPLSNDGKLPLKLYNNYVRWVWVYVQYIGKDGQNLSLNPNAQFPDTKHAQSLGLLPQVFTVLGVPVWDTNTIEVELDFPEGAHSARILFCGLGSNLLDGSWRQYFPADAYPDRIAPTDEVIFASCVTGLLTIGLTAFALATDINVAAAFGALRNELEYTGKELSDFLALLDEFGTLAAGTQALTAAETAATAVAAGGATYADIADNGGSTANIWSILLGAASVIPKIIFSPTSSLLKDLAAAVLSSEAAARVEDAIPIVGQVLAIAEAVGDAATLAEVCLESALCPWVIENEVSLQYPARVKIKPDPRNHGDFPATAKSWRLEAKIDGGSALSPITGSTSDKNYDPSRPLEVDVTAPFGGKVIQWSFVMLDGPLDDKGQPTGYQVGTGVSAQHGNDDPNDVFSSPEITITQLPATITASTVFERARTTAYRTASPSGYGWSAAVNPTGTVADSPIKSITGTTVATLAGMAGLVWLQDGRYYIRGVPLSAANDTIIPLGGTPHEGYARRPFVLFDALVSPGDAGNHVLLEPDETNPGYHIRKVTLDPDTGSISWRSDVSHGDFSLPVSAAALHSSGRVVAVHTASGRLAWLSPAQTPRPPLAAYSAGPGSQVGLLDTPVSIAVTNPGVVLVLEAGASQVSAFDLNGTPAAYFKPQSAGSRLAARRRFATAAAVGDSDLAFSMPLVSDGTYLDIAVDGAGQIYLLYFTGDGGDPEDYRVDVYNQDGTPLNTNSPGVNVAQLAVDYWRSIYGANYSALDDVGTDTPHISSDLKVLEPSLSRFDPVNR